MKTLWEKRERLDISRTQSHFSLVISSVRSIPLLLLNVVFTTDWSELHIYHLLTVAGVPFFQNARTVCSSRVRFNRSGIEHAIINARISRQGLG